MSYLEEALNDIFTNHTQYDELVLEQMEAEAEFISSCLESNIILEAEANVITKGKGKLDALVAKVKEFFKRVVNDFKTKCSEMYSSQAEEWLKENGDLIERIDYTGLTIEMIPFWNVTLTDITAILDKLVAAIDNIPSEAQLKNIKSITDVETLAPFRDYLKDKQGFAKSIKDYFRTGKGELKAVKISDEELKTKCISVFKPYIINFNKDVVTMIQNRRIKLDAAMDKVKATSNNNLKESFSLLENCMFSDTELRYCSNYQSVMEEAEADNKPVTTSQPQSEKEDDKPNTREVTLTDENNPKDADGKPIQSSQSTKSASETEYIKYAISLNQIALSAAMDILMEKFSVYLKPLKSIVSARKDTAKAKEE